ncbi:MAG: hypothetical protein PVH65_09415 [Chloroflexota bacterium]|jgi:hypothetical protein
MAKTKDWNSEGVRIEVDDDQAEISSKAYGDPPPPSNFKIIRKLINFEVKVSGENKQVPTTFVACYTAADASAAGGANKLKLVMWSPDQNNWKNIPITKSVPVPAGFSGFAGAFEAKITARWPDPPVAWGDSG